jgi:predicted RNA-binding Zn-ribbon protein involved in translation (DUF1610 family)
MKDKMDFPVGVVLPKPAVECPNCGEVELRLEPSTSDSYINEFYCDACPYMETGINRNYNKGT